MKLIKLLKENIDREYYISLLINDMGYNEEDVNEVLDEIIDSIKNLPDPIKLYRIIKVDNEKNINKEELGNHYSLDRDELLNSHTYADGYGDESYLITVSAPKNIIDFQNTLHNNILYPNENEVTLKNKGKGTTLLSIKKIRG
jgi:hypothetical protein